MGDLPMGESDWVTYVIQATGENVEAIQMSSPFTLRSQFSSIKRKEGDFLCRQKDSELMFTVAEKETVDQQWERAKPPAKTKRKTKKEISDAKKVLEEAPVEIPTVEDTEGE